MLLPDSLQFFSFLSGTFLVHGLNITVMKILTPVKLHLSCYRISNKTVNSTYISEQQSISLWNLDQTLTCVYIYMHTTCATTCLNLNQRYQLIQIHVNRCGNTQRCVSVRYISVFMTEKILCCLLYFDSYTYFVYT